MILTKNCKTCNKIIIYKNKCSYRYAIRTNSDCKTCSALKRKPKSEEVKQKISKSLCGRKLNDNIKNKISNTLKQKFNTPEYNQKFKIQNGGQNNPNFGNRYSKEIKDKISRITKEKMQDCTLKERLNNIRQSKEYRQKLSNSLKGRFFSKETRKRMREAVVRRVKKYGIHSRNFNPKACEFIDKWGKENGYNFQHALNGGEISIIGYLVDGYDKDKNIVIEIDEKRHFDINGNLKEKDIKRQKEIEKYLNCKFIRIPFIKN